MVTAFNAAQAQTIREDIQFSVGGHSSQNNEGLLGKLVTWEKDASSSCCPSAVKAYILFFVDKLFVFLDWTTIGPRICDGGLRERLQATRNSYELEPTVTEPERPLEPTIAERNRIAREKIINTLGGPARYQAIPVVALPNADFQQNLSVSDDLFPQGQWIIRGEDGAGREFVAMRVQLSKIGEEEPVRPIEEYFPDGVIPADWGPPLTFRTIHENLQTTHVITIHQEQRETEAELGLWSMNLAVEQPIPIDFSFHGDDLEPLPVPFGPPAESAILWTLRELRRIGDTSILQGRRENDLKEFTFLRAPKP